VPSAHPTSRAVQQCVSQSRSLDLSPLALPCFPCLLLTQRSPDRHPLPSAALESWHVWNVTSHLLRAGASFCTQPAAELAGRFRSWRTRLEEVCTNHRNNNAFIVYHSAYEAACARLRVFSERRQGAGEGAGARAPPDWRAIVASKQLAEDRGFTSTQERRRAEGTCDTANVSAADLIDAFGNDTEVTISMAKAMLRRSSERDQPPNCAAMAPERIASIERAIGALPSDRRVGLFLSKWGAWSVTLATAYHKLAPMCEPADPLYKRFKPNDWACTEQPLPSEPDGKIVYDLIPLNASLGYCYGDACTAATLAIDAYRDFLHQFSHLRTSIVHALLSRQCPFDDGAFLEELLSLRHELPLLLATMRRASAGLASMCAVPSRSMPDTMRKNWEHANFMIASWKADQARAARKGT
jgi:hypothetical protein